MKKVITMILTVALVVSFATTALAASGLNSAEKEILSTLKAGVEFNGKVQQLPAEYLNQAENYLMRDGVEVDETQKATIVAKIDEATTILEKSGVKNIADLKAEDKQAVIKLAQESASVVGLKLTYDSSKKDIVIKDSTGKVVFIAEDIIKKTGAPSNNFVIIAIAAMAILATAGIAVAKKRAIQK